MSAIKAKQFRKRSRNESSDEDGGTEISGVTKAPIAKRPALNTFSTGSSSYGDKSKDILNTVTATYTSDKAAAPHAYGGGAFATNEIDTQHDRDARAILEKRLAMQNDSVAALEAGQKLYRGDAGHSNYVTKDLAETIARSKVHGTLGPLRAPTNVRGICRIDYQPDICKDYKETGFCGFGDSCKFLHDRGDYKAGWQLDIEWDEKQKAKKAAMERRVAAGEDPSDVDESNPFLIKDGADEEDEEGLPFACHICREPFTRAVQTNCGHYFCERCAVARYAEDPHCAICGKQTHGIFNFATKLNAKVKLRLAQDPSLTTQDDAKGYVRKSSHMTGSAPTSRWAVVEEIDQSDTAANAESKQADAREEASAEAESDEKQYISTFEAPASPKNSE
jgi:RING finger protein 113A